LAVNQTALGRLQKKNRCASLSTELQSDHISLMLLEYLAALLLVANALLMSLHVKVLRTGGHVLCFQTLCIICIAWGETLLVPELVDAPIILCLRKRKHSLQYKYH
jgi:hypothetical protein